MTRITALWLAVFAVSACSQDAPAPAALAYPATDVVDQVDNYHGTDVADPYRWLEDDVRESEAVSNWVGEQNAVTFAYLDGIGEREPIRQRLEQLWNFERYSTPFKRGGRYFYSRNDGLQNQSVIYMQDTLDSEPEMVVDPNTWSDDGTVALGSYFPSRDGRYFAYLVQESGSDWRTVKVLNLETGETLADELNWLKFTGLSWAPDNSGFYYSRFPETDSDEKFQSLNKNQAVYFHRIGTSQSDDELVFTDPENPEWGYFGGVTDDGRYLVLTVWQGTDSRYQVLVQDLQQEGSKPEFLIQGFDYDYSFIGNNESQLFFRTDNGAPRGRLIMIDLENPAEENWQEIIPESQDVLSSANLVGGRLIAEYMQDAWSLIRVYGLDGENLGSVDLPGIGTASGFGGRADDPETFYSYQSFNTPTVIHQYNVETGESKEFKRASMDIDTDDYVVEQVFYESKDGTKVPMFIAHHKDVTPDGNSPTLLYGYGGFDISLTPSFSITRLAWMEMGGVYAVANLRGGGEYGAEWHKAGTKLQKQNVFDDFIAAGEYLLAEGYTNPEKLAILGGSNGGLLVGAVTNQRPDLFGAAIPAVGVMDMLRFHQFTAGRYWVDDYGSADDPEEFQALLAYSPYHNVKKGTEYPAVLVTTADTDDRVVPGHSFKYAAAIQEAQGGTAPVLIRIESSAGHGAGVPTEKRIQEYADMWSFLVENLDFELPEGYGESS